MRALLLIDFWFPSPRLTLCVCVCVCVCLAYHHHTALVHVMFCVQKDYTMPTFRWFSTLLRATCEHGGFSFWSVSWSPPAASLG